VRFRLPAIVVLAVIGALPAPARGVVLTVSPAPVSSAGELALSGSGFAPGSGGVVRLGRERTVTVRTSPSGTFARALELEGRVARGARTVRLRARVGRRHVTLDVPIARRGSGATLASLSASDSGARIRVAPVSASPGVRVGLRGHLTPGRRSVSVLVGRTVVAAGRTDRAGRFALGFRAPAGIVRAHRLTVRDGRRELAIPFAGRPAPAPLAPSPTPIVPVPALLGPSPDPILVAAGDIACAPGDAPTVTSCQQAATAEAARDAHPDAIAVLGDEQYEDGSTAEFRGGYEPSWGPLKALTRPVPGNHEYGADPKAAGYFDTFGASAGPRDKGYYSYEVGAWHVIALNSNCKRVGGCEETSAQGAWLKADLAAHPTRCTLAYWHHALFTSAVYPEESPSMAPIWRILDAAGTDVVLAGHIHAYERFASQHADRRPDPVAGIREFVVGSGGKEHIPYSVSRAPNSETSNDYDFGVLALTLRSTGYAWRFVNAGPPGVFRDTGADACH